MTENLPPETTLPHSNDAEQSVLGAVLLDNHIFNQAAQLLVAEDFFFPNHQKIFQRMADLSEQNQAIDMVTLKAELQRFGELESIGGTAYLASLINGLPRSENIEHYATIVRERAVLRRLIDLSNRTMARCLKGKDEPSLVLDETEREIFTIAEHHVKSGFQPVRQLLHPTITYLHDLSRNRKSVTGVPTGFKMFDEKTAGLQRSDMIVVAARPSMGKTAWALNVAQNASLDHGLSVGVFSLEMSRQQLVLRLLSSIAEVDHNSLRTGYISKSDWQRIENAQRQLEEARLFIDDTASMSIVEMRSKARRLKAEHGLDLIIIDYLQLMSSRESGRRSPENRTQEISAISRAIKGLAKELNIPVIAISQLNRGPEARPDDHRPQLSDLRESGAIEQDADVVVFVHREDRYRKKKSPKEPEEEEPDNPAKPAEIIIAKQRNGPTGTVKLVFFSRQLKFITMAEEFGDSPE